MPQTYPDPQIIVPCGFDRATGTNTSAGLLPGTPNPIGLLDFFTSSTGQQVIFEELPDSPEVELGEQGTVVHRFRITWNNGFILLQGLPRGLLQTDTYYNTYRILSAKLTSDRGTMCVLTVISESVSFDTPPDEFSCTPVELGINIIKHPRYLYALLPNYRQSQNQVPPPPPFDTDTQIGEKQDVINLIQNWQDAPTPPQRSGIVTQLQILSPQDATKQYAEGAAQEIIQKLWNQEDSPYLVAWQIVWAQYFWFPQYLNPGGYIEDPIQTGGLPPYFGSPDGDYSISTIFDKMAALNPQCYRDFFTGGLNISWLRKADTQEFQRTWYKVTKTWIGSAIGHWDSQLYSQLPRPTTSSPNDPSGNPYILLQSSNNFFS